MIFSFDLLINAVVSGILIGGFYAAVTSGVSLSFGILDIVNIAHPAFIILGSYIAYIANATFGIDPIVAAIIAIPLFYILGAVIYQIYTCRSKNAARNRYAVSLSFSAFCSSPR